METTVKLGDKNASILTELDVAQKEGYVRDFNRQGNDFHCPSIGRTLKEHDITVDKLVVVDQGSIYCIATKGEHNENIRGTFIEFNEASNC